MRKKLYIFLLLILSQVSNLSFAEEISVRVSHYPPFFERSESGSWSGLSIELAEALLDEAGIKPVYRQLPFKRALVEMEKGRLDMMLNLTVTPERERYIHFVGPQLDETVVMVIAKDADVPVTGLDDLKQLNLPIAVELGKFYGREFEEKRKHDPQFAAKLDVVKQLETMERMLANGRLSGFLGYGYSIYARFRSNPLYKQFQLHPRPLRQDWVYYGFSRHSVSAETLENLEAAYQRLREKGVLQAIWNKYRL